MTKVHHYHLLTRFGGAALALVFDNDGDVIGIVVASIGSFSGFIPTSALCAELLRVQ